MVYNMHACKFNWGLSNLGQAYKVHSLPVTVSQTWTYVACTTTTKQHCKISNSRNLTHHAKSVKRKKKKFFNTQKLNKILDGVQKDTCRLFPWIGLHLCVTSIYLLCPGPDKHIISLKRVKTRQRSIIKYEFSACKVFATTKQTL